jgi:hypothetical protein
LPIERRLAAAPGVIGHKQVSLSRPSRQSSTANGRTVAAERGGTGRGPADRTTSPGSTSGTWPCDGEVEVEAAFADALGIGRR